MDTGSEATPDNKLLEGLYEKRYASKDAMAPHMPTLKELASECDVCVEFGVRRANSTVALLSGTSGEVWSYDIEKHWPEFYDKIAAAVGDRWHLVIHDSVTADVPECDLLLHDSLHDYEQVLAELKAHGNKARKYICFHDTVACGDHGHTLRNPKPDPSIRGMMAAINSWLKRPQNNGKWVKKLHHKHSNGFLVLERVAQNEQPSE